MCVLLGIRLKDKSSFVNCTIIREIMINHTLVYFCLSINEFSQIILARTLQPYSKFLYTFL